MQRGALCRSRRELSNEYLLAKFGFDTAENEPCEVCPLSAYRSPRFEEANLKELWERNKDRFDEPGVNWGDILSLGEQQRVQFARVFYHNDWHKKVTRAKNRKSHGASAGFFAVLDESTSLSLV